MQMSRSTDALRTNIMEIVRGRLVCKRGRPHDTTGLFNAMVDVCGLGGDDSLLSSETQAGCKQTKKFKHDLAIMSREALLDDDGNWVVYLADGMDEADIDLEQELARILAPIFVVFIKRRWDVAALSRWVGVSRTLKRCALGSMLNGLIPEAIGGMGKTMQVDERALQREVQKQTAAALAGAEYDSNRVTSMSRIHRVSTFFQIPERRWQLGIAVKVVSIVEELHWTLLGGKGRPKASIATLVDPGASVVALALNKLYNLLLDWDPAHDAWSHLRFFGVTNFSNEQLMLSARAQCVQVGARLFFDIEKRFASWPYRAQWLHSPSTNEQERAAVRDEILAARPCCLGAFLTHFRNLFPTDELMQSDLALTTLMLFMVEIRFFHTSSRMRTQDIQG